MALVSRMRSTLNPNAPLFIPAAYQQVEDFSPEWWELVKTSTWFMDYWLAQHQEEESFIGNANEDDDVVNLLPDAFDLDADEDMDAQLEEFILSSEENGSALSASKPQNGMEMNAEAVVKNLIPTKFPKSQVEPAKYHEKPPHCISPKCSPRRIHQPR